jgi:hypothetical protein
MQTLLAELGFPQVPTTIFEDNQACIALAKNPQNHKRTKHIQVRYFFIRQYLEDVFLDLKYCGTLEQLADPFTKILPGHRLRPTLSYIGLSKLHSQGEREN